MALRVVDRAMQVHGAEGISQDKPLAYYYATLRTLRYADVSGGEQGGEAASRGGAGRRSGV
jgi:alkylation response protein AidB-like acyl-CoA dehydrogenase